MRSIRHWTPRYVVNRLAVGQFRKDRGETLPLLAIGAVQFLENWLTPEDIVFEYGSGGSTAWFGKRVKRLISVEHDPKWYELVKLATQQLNNVELVFREGSDFIHHIKNYEESSFDLVLNDGYGRPYAGVPAVDFVKKGGIFAWDDWAGSYPVAGTHVPHALKPGDRIHESVAEFLNRVQDWRRVVFDDGIHSTALFFRPM